jgi:hypothetical protein
VNCLLSRCLGSVRDRFDSDIKQEQTGKKVGDVMTTHICVDCDSPGDGICSACHGTGNTTGNVNAPEDALSCPECRGTGECRSCGGFGEVEVGGEGD